MCISQYVQSRHWNWAGDEIVHDPIVPSHRLVPGRESRVVRGGYPIDPRQFLVTQNNALLQDCLRNLIQPGSGDPLKFRSRDTGSFDFRADVITRWVAENVRATADGQDIWLFPHETLYARKADCEDRAILLAALLIASGISGYNVRVALGRLVFHDHRRTARDPRNARQQVVESFQHAWVVYRREDGSWEVKEPVAVPKRRRRPASPRLRRLLGAKVEYEPAFVFNGDHLWRVRGTRTGSFDAATLRKEWKRLEPAFAGDVHRLLLHDALGGYGTDVVEELRRSFTYMFGSYVDWPDMPSRYDPRDHFDNCRIQDSWDRAQEHLQTFANTRELREFGLAAHSIGDFYAHTSYGHFAAEQALGSHGGLVPFDPAWLAGAGVDAHLAQPAHYDGGTFDLHKAGFTRGPLWGDRGVDAAAAEWQGKLISGRYAHVGDSQAFFERFTWMPDSVWNSPGFWRCAAAPHHEEMAVDSPHGSNVLYSAADYAEQFERRYATAAYHVRAEFEKVWGPPSTPHPF
jgi:hypothetical protein